MVDEVQPADESGLGLAFGTYEEAIGWIGRSTEPSVAEFPVNVPMIRYYCSAMEDANPGYWDDAFARAHWGARSRRRGCSRPGRSRCNGVRKAVGRSR